jgi:hypothetical protein
VVALTVVSVALEVFPELEGEQARHAIASAVENSLIKIAFLLRSLSRGMLLRRQRRSAIAKKGRRRKVSAASASAGIDPDALTAARRGSCLTAIHGFAALLSRRGARGSDIRSAIARTLIAGTFRIQQART